MLEIVAQCGEVVGMDAALPRSSAAGADAGRFEGLPSEGARGSQSCARATAPALVARSGAHEHTENPLGKTVHRAKACPGNFP